MPPSDRTLDLTPNVDKIQLARTLLAALGFTTIFLLWLIQPAVESTQYIFYHWRGDPKTLFVTIAVDMLAVWFALTLLLLMVRIPGRTRVAIWAGLLLFTPWNVYQNWCALTHVHPYRRYSCALFFGALIATSFLTARWRPAFAQRFERIIASATTILVFAGFFGVFLLCNLAWYGWQAHIVFERPAHHHQAVATIQPNRIIWIVFDELSYDQLYEHRFPGLQLPAFDALAKQSTVFTDAIPPYIYTEVVLPGLLTGNAFDKIKTSARDRISLLDSNTGKWQSFNQHDTVFQDALDAGYSTAVAGWYNPYCRILPQVLDQCFWADSSAGSTNGMMSYGTIASNTLNALEMFSCTSLSAGPYKLQHSFSKCMELLHKDPGPRVETHIMDYQDLYTASQKLLRDPSASFVFLHLPVPHPGGIYDRKTGKLTTSSSSYIDNLALTDKCLAELRATLEQTGQWNSSTIVIMGDHSWRTQQAWKGAFGWTAEDDEASHGGQYDPRPGYIVKLPNQTTGTRIDTPFHTVNTRKLLDELLTHKITSPAELSNWAQSVH